MNEARLQPVLTYVSEAELIKIVDGDTLRVLIDLGYSISVQRDVRLSGVDTPEIRGPERRAGKYVSQRVESWIIERGGYKRLLLNSLDYSTGKYGRSLAEVWVGGECLNDYLLDEGLGWPTDSKGRLTKSRDLTELNLPEICYKSNS